MKTTELTIRRTQLAENNQSGKEKIINEFSDLKRYRKKDTIETGIFPVKQTTRQVTLHLQEV